MPNWFVGRTRQGYLGEESSYGTSPTLQATNALRIMPGSLKIGPNPRNLAKSPERHTTPGQRALYNRRGTADFGVKAAMYPSGVLNTVPELDVVLKNGLGGTPTNITLATTFSGVPTTTTGTVASSTGLAVGQPVQIGIAGVGLFVRWLTAKSGSDLTWAPALPSAPVAGDALKGCVGYSLATALPKSLTYADYPQAPSASTPARELNGIVLDKLSFMFDGNTEPSVQIGGPAKGLAGSAQAQPGGFTTVGSEAGIPSGLTGYFQLGATLYEIEKLQIDVVNGMDVQNTALGTSLAKAFFRKGKRFVTGKMSAKVSDDTTAWAASLSNASNPAMLQIGLTSGRIWAFYMPAFVIDAVPDFQDNDETNDWDFSFQALETAGNDEFYTAAA